jgi:hypothetical protein
VQHDDVARGDPPSELLERLSQRLLVHAAFRLAEALPVERS